MTQAVSDKSISAPNEFGRSAEALLAELLVNMTAEWRVKPSSCRRELIKKSELMNFAEESLSERLVFLPDFMRYDFGAKLTSTSEMMSSAKRTASDFLSY